MYDWNKHIIREDASLVEALQHLNSLSGQTMVLFVLDDNDRLLGTLTDGDIRRFIISHRNIDSIFVLSGEGKREDIERDSIHPTWVYDDIGAVLRAWEETP